MNAARQEWRRLCISVAMVVWLGAVTGTITGTAWAQNPSPAPSGSGEAAPPTAQESYLHWIVRCSGLIGAVILLLSIYFLATVIRMFLELRPEVAMPPEILRQTQEMLTKRDMMGIYNLVKADGSFFSRLVRKGLAEMPNGLAGAREAMDAVGDAMTVEMERRISMLAVLGTLGPMIGLLGTLKGMISSFSVIAMSDVQLKTSQVATGISEALLLTFEGVALSVPAIYFYAVFRNRVSTISVQTMLATDEFLRHFYLAAHRKPSAAAAAPPPSSSAP